MRVLIHVALFAMLAAFSIPSIDGCCCSLLAACTGPNDCNIFGCNCETHCYKGRCGYCYRCSTTIDFKGGDVGIGVGGEKGGIGINLDFDIVNRRLALHDGNLECCGSGCRRRRRSFQDMKLVSSSLTLGTVKNSRYSWVPKPSSDYFVLSSWCFCPILSWKLPCFVSRA